MAKKSRKALIEDFMAVFEMLSIKVQQTDQSCTEIVRVNNIDKYDLALIGFIGRQEAVIMREIAEHLNVPYSTATGIVDRLVKSKMLQRVHSEDDRRIVKVELTPKRGKEVFEQYLAFRHKLGSIVLAHMDERDFEDIDRIMKKMVKQISDHQIKEIVSPEVTSD